MPRKAPVVHADEETLTSLKRLANSQSSQLRLVRRARIILRCIAGDQIKDIATELGESENIIIKWRNRFIEKGIYGLYDEERSGKPREYGDDFRQQVLDMLATKPPEGLKRWNGTAIAKQLSASEDAVWRLLHSEGIRLTGHKDEPSKPVQTTIIVELIDLFLAPGENAAVISVSERQGRLQRTVKAGVENRKIVTAIKDSYRANEGRDTPALYSESQAADFTEFMDGLIERLPQRPGVRYHIILDGGCAQKNKAGWFTREDAFFHFSPAGAWQYTVELILQAFRHGEGGDAKTVQSAEIMAKINSRVSVITDAVASKTE